MMINRNNYEEFFLMYVDGELSAAEKETVEAFVKQNPDLKEELNMLQQAVLLPEENIVFDKSSLFRHSGNEITTANYEEKFLLYVDEELSVKDKAEVETFVLQHPQLQDDFTLLKQTKLPIETIEFTNKEVLYRKEEKERRIIYMRWYRMAAAAVIIGLGVVLYTVIPPSKIGSQGSLADNVIKVTEPQNSVAVNKSTAVATTVNPSLQNDDQVIKTGILNKDVAVVKNEVAISKKTQIIPATKSNQSTSNDLDKDAPKTDFIAALNNDHQPEKTVPESVTNNNIARNTAKEIIDEPAPINVTAKNGIDNQNSMAVRQVAYKELDTNDEKKSLLLGSVEINKDKLRGFFRKASRLFGNKQKSDDDKLAIASLAVNK